MSDHHLSDVLRKTMPEQCGYPHALVRACEDQSEYKLRLRTGELIRFSLAWPVSHEWVYLDTAGSCEVPPSTDEGVFDCPRGIDVRVDAIVWVQ